MEETPTPAELRQRARDALVRPGGRRKRTLATLARVDEELRPLVVQAIRNEVPYREITQLTGLAPWTIRQWTKDAK